MKTKMSHFKEIIFYSVVLLFFLVVILAKNTSTNDPSQHVPLAQDTSGE